MEEERIDAVAYPEGVSMTVLEGISALLNPPKPEPNEKEN